MIIPFGEGVDQLQLRVAATELESCSRAIEQHGLSLSPQDILALVAGRLEALDTSDRVEFGGGVSKELVLAFAGSPHVSQSTFVQTLLELQELFYEFKNESLEQIPDDELIGKMRVLFDEQAQGDFEYLAEALFDGLGRHVREGSGISQPTFDQLTNADRIDAGAGYDDAADPGADNAVANMHTLATHRYDVSRWVDETYSPAWEGSSWLDE